MGLLTMGPGFRTNHDRQSVALLTLVGLLVWIELVKLSRQLGFIKGGSDHGTTTDASTSMHTRAVYLYLDKEAVENMEAAKPAPFTMDRNVVATSITTTQAIKSITTTTTTDLVLVDDVLPCDDIDIDNSSSSSSSLLYGWLGNQWFPPKHVPFYTPQMMRTLFGGQNVLWAGDTTARQDHATMWSILNATKTYRMSRSKSSNEISSWFSILARRVLTKISFPNVINLYHYTRQTTTTTTTTTITTTTR
jgi:hypothetical protein